MCIWNKPEPLGTGLHQYSLTLISLAFPECSSLIPLMKDGEVLTAGQGGGRYHMQFPL